MWSVEIETSVASLSVLCYPRCYQDRTNQRHLLSELGIEGIPKPRLAQKTEVPISV
jgi:hypothetical protein